jgi:hypothetical protein
VLTATVAASTSASITTKYSTTNADTAERGAATFTSTTTAAIRYSRSAGCEIADTTIDIKHTTITTITTITATAIVCADAFNEITLAIIATVTTATFILHPIGTVKHTTSAGTSTIAAAAAVVFNTSTTTVHSSGHIGTFAAGTIAAGTDITSSTKGFISSTMHTRVQSHDAAKNHTSATTAIGRSSPNEHATTSSTTDRITPTVDTAEASAHTTATSHRASTNTVTATAICGTTAAFLTNQSRRK